MTTTVDHAGLQYIFAYLSKKKNKWLLCSHKFRLQINKQYIIGQYITSMWFSAYLIPGEDAHFMILGIKGKLKYDMIESIINKEATLGAPIGMLERKGNILFKDYYMITKEDSLEMLDALKIGDICSKRFEVIGCNHDSQFTIHVHLLDEKEKPLCLYLSTPNLTR